MNNALIRRMQATDWEEIGNIYTAITQKNVQDEFKRIVEKSTQSETDASFVAEIDGVVVGYMTGSVLNGGFGIHKAVWITMLGVNPQYMGRGVGASLANAIFEFSKARDIKNIYTSVRWDSSDLLSFFKTLNFGRSEFINLTKVLAQ